MKERLVRIAVGWVFFAMIYIAYSLLFKDGMRGVQIILLSLAQSLGLEFIVPQLVKLGKHLGRVSKE